MIKVCEINVKLFCICVLLFRWEDAISFCLILEGVFKIDSHPIALKVTRKELKLSLQTFDVVVTAYHAPIILSGM